LLKNPSLNTSDEELLKKATSEVNKLKSKLKIFSVKRNACLDLKSMDNR
jgi:hypothetical protein